MVGKGVSVPSRGPRKGRSPVDACRVVNRLRVGNKIHEVVVGPNPLVDAERQTVVYHRIRPTSRIGQSDYHKSEKCKEHMRKICAKKGEPTRNPNGMKGKDGKGNGVGRLPRYIGKLFPISKMLTQAAELECVDAAFVEKYGEGIPIGQAIMIQTLDAALQNDPAAREFFAERTEGKVTQHILVSDGKIKVSTNGIEELPLPSQDEQIIDGDN